jgi:RNA polymerase sigma factor for flagellar operon FliA
MDTASPRDRRRPRETQTLTAADRDQLVVDHRYLAETLAWRYVQRVRGGIDVDDLISDGYHGLSRAARTYDPSLGGFQTFAWPCIKGAILDGVRRRDHASRGLRSADLRMQRARYRFASREHRFPTDRELADELGWTATQVHKWRTRLLAADPLSIHAPAPSEDPDGIPIEDGDAIRDPSADTEADALAAIAAGEASELARLVQLLPGRQQQVLRLYFWGEMTLSEIGDLLGVHESRVCQLKTLALSRLRVLIEPLAA